MSALFLLKTLGLFIATAIAEIVGCYLPYLWLKEGHSVWLLIPAAISLALFAYLLTFHPAESGRVYAAYGGIYIMMSLLWVALVEKHLPSIWDGLGAMLCIVGALVIFFNAQQVN